VLGSIWRGRSPERLPRCPLHTRSDSSEAPHGSIFRAVRTISGSKALLRRKCGALGGAQVARSDRDRANRRRNRTARVKARQERKARVAEATKRRAFSAQVGGNLDFGNRRGSGGGSTGTGGRASGSGTSEGPDLLFWGSLALGAFLLLKK